jgi:hypothetical protein
MNGIYKTKHFSQHCQQRGINDSAVAILLKYGEIRSSLHGIDSLIFTKSSLAEIKNDCGSIIFKMCEKRRNAYIITSEDGALITAARSHCKAIH